MASVQTRYGMIWKFDALVSLFLMVFVVLCVVLQPKSHHSRTNHHPSRDQQRHYNSDSQLIYSKCASSIDVYSSISNFSVPTRLNTVTDENGILLHLLDLDDLNPEGSLDETYTIVVTNNEAPRHNRSTAHVPPHCRELDRQADHTVCRFVDHRVPIEPLRQELVSDSPRVMYEMHIETFSPDGTFDGAISKLPYLVALGITCIEIMPVNEGKYISIEICIVFTFLVLTKLTFP